MSALHLKADKILYRARSAIGSGKGMAGSNEGVDPSDHPRLGEIQRVLSELPQGRAEVR